MVDRIPRLLLSILSHSAHDGAPPMNDIMRIKPCTSKTAENRVFYSIPLPVIKEFGDILKYERAQWDKLISRAFFCSAKKSHERFLPKLDVLSDCGSNARHTKRGHNNAFVLFLGNIS